MVSEPIEKIHLVSYYYIKNNHGCNLNISVQIIQLVRFKFVFVETFPCSEGLEKIRSDHNQLYMHFPRLTTISAYYLPLKCRSIYILSEQSEIKTLNVFKYQQTTKQLVVFMP